MQRAIRVSVIIPFLDAERFLEEAIESVVAQTYDAWELLLMDDGSTDGSTAIARGYAERFPQHIRYFSHPGRENRGQGATRNLGFAHAKGEYVAMLDSDDIAESEWLENQVAYLDAHPGTAVVGCWYTEVDSSGRYRRRQRNPCNHLDIRWAVHFYSPISQSAVMLRKQAILERVGGYNEALRTSQDFELWSRIAKRLECANLPQFLARVRLHDSSITVTTGKKAQIGHRLRVQAVAEMMDWEQDSFAVNEGRLHAMSCLLVGIVGGCSTEAFEDAAGNLFRLHATFCDAARLPRAVALEHRRRLQHQVSANLLALGIGCRSRRLLTRGYRLHPAVLRDGRALVWACARGLRQLLPTQAANAQ